MIKAYSKTFPKGIDVDGLVNRGGWFGKTWLVLIGSGFDPARLVVEADYEADVIDQIVDSKRWKHLLITDELCEACQEAVASGEEDISYANCECVSAGNYGEPIDETLLRLIERCDKVDYFAKKEY